jgi:hypothetical protein
MAKDLAYNAEHDIDPASNLRLQEWKEEKLLEIPPRFQWYFRFLILFPFRTYSKDPRVFTKESEI